MTDQGRALVLMLVVPDQRVMRRRQFQLMSQLNPKLRLLSLRELLLRALILLEV